MPDTVPNTSDRRHELSDEEIIRHVLAGETELFERLMRKYNQRIYRTVRAILRDDSDAEDVMQQAYINAFTHLAQFGERAKFSTWMTRIAMNEAFARIRRRGHDPLENASAEESEEDPMRQFKSPLPGPERQAMTTEVKQLLEEAIESLSEHYRSVLMLREVEGLSTGETAECLGVSEDVVKTRLHRARGLVRDHLFAESGLTYDQLFDFQAPRCNRVVATVFEAIRRDDPYRPN
ncbi:MAG: RNA polymerase sigma factor [Thermoanaerobaculia bacterium]